FDGFFYRASNVNISGGNFSNHNAQRDPDPNHTNNRHALRAESSSSNYARLLLPQRMGYPLWSPGVPASLPFEYRKNGVSIGDVGAIDERGRFQYFFNILLPADHPCNGANRVPAGFTPLIISTEITRVPDFRGPGAYVHGPESGFNREDLKAHDGDGHWLYRRDVEIGQNNGTLARGVGFGWDFTSSGTEGALLILPEGASQEDHENEDAFDNYAAKNAISWYEHVNGHLGRRLGGNALMVVTGVDKTTAWGVASFSNAVPNSVRMDFIPGIQTATKYRFRQVAYAATNSGPSVSDDSLTGKPNQCIFVRSIRVAVRPRLLSGYRKGSTSALSVKTDPIRSLSVQELLSRSSFIPFQSFSGTPTEPTGSNSLSDIPSQELIVTTAAIPAKHTPYHPAAVINDFLLNQFPEANIAVTRDKHWFSLIKAGEEALPDDAQLQERLQKQFLTKATRAELVVDGVVRPHAINPASLKSSPESVTTSAFDSGYGDSQFCV
ncbi:hypothetical protein WG66_007409, partial [Moniliophthora roreri]